jgi:uncharacterized membrane protein
MIPQQNQLPIFGFFKLNFILYLICVIWLLIIVIVPTAIPKDTVDLGELGMVGENEHFFEIEDINNPFVRSVYHSGDSMCHLKASRSLFINSNQMPYCARDFGVFLGFAIGAAISTFVIIDLKWWLLVVGLAPIGLDGGIQLLTSYQSNNPLRIFTGTLAGIVTMIAMGLIIFEISQLVKYKLEYRAWSKKYGNKRPSETKSKESTKDKAKSR